jgi:hypothetical protein
MSKEINKKGIVYWLEQIANALGASATVPAQYEVENITAISGDILSALKCGDQVIKITGAQKHTYTVSYKGQGVGQGICLTYVDAATVETVAYDYTESGWAYNSTDHTTLTPDA